jgi:D-alanine-D-alanine ligase-like ATP-grasp enzyme
MIINYNKLFVEHNILSNTANNFSYNDNKDLHFYCYSLAAKTLGLEIIPNKQLKTKDIYAGKKIGFLKNMISSLVSRKAINLVKQKSLVQDILLQSDVSIPSFKSFVCDDNGYEEAYSFWSKKTFQDYVLKPSDNRAGMGITVGIKDKTSFDLAWNYAKNNLIKSNSRILVEEYINGIDVRVLVVGDQAVCATTRIPAYVIGDGISNVTKLVIDKNKIRSQHPHHRLYPIVINNKNISSYIPNNREIVFLSNKSNIHQGGEAFDVTSLINTNIKNMAIKAASSIHGNIVSGVDLIVTDLYSDCGKVIEMNASANFAIHYYPMFGVSHNPALSALKLMLEKQRQTTLSQYIRYQMKNGKLKQYSQYVDKYEVRKYVKEFFPEAIVPLIGDAYTDVEQINQDKLPNSFVIKPTHMCGKYIIVKNKNKFNINNHKEEINKWIHSYYRRRREPQYDFDGKVIIEPFLGEDLLNAHWFCFRGFPKVFCLSNTKSKFKKQKRWMNYYDENFNLLPIKKKIYRVNKLILNLTSEFEQTKNMAKILSENIKPRVDFLRVDFYIVNKKIYFSELTFSPASGGLNISNKTYERLWHSYLINTKEQKN